MSQSHGGWHQHLGPPQLNHESFDGSSEPNPTYFEPNQSDLPPQSWWGLPNGSNSAGTSAFEPRYSELTIGDNDQPQTHPNTPTAVNEQGYPNPDIHSTNVAHPDLGSQGASNSIYSGRRSYYADLQESGSSLAEQSDFQLLPSHSNAQPTLDVRADSTHTYPYNIPGPASHGSGPSSHFQQSTMQPFTMQPSTTQPSYHRQDISYGAVAQPEVLSVPGELAFRNPENPVHNPPRAAAQEARPPTPRPDDTSFEARLRQAALTELGQSNLSAPSLNEPDSTSESRFDAPPTPIIFVSSIDEVKDDAWERMMKSLFEVSLFPTQLEVSTLAQTALDNAIGTAENEELKKWVSRREGRAEIKRLNGALKTIFDGFEAVNQLFITGVYEIPLGVSEDKTNVLSSRIARVIFLLSNFMYLDEFRELSIVNGESRWLRIPFGHAAIMVFLEYFLLQRKFIGYVSFNDEGWERRLSNVIALAATFCYWGLCRCSHSGWFVHSEFDTPENRQCYNTMISRMRSLVGTEKMLFDQRLIYIRHVLN
ncbi:hypothetical protein EDD22DRAFT_849119 [Suillus occidentalis]|nr:hypothetical protein EDD22DRAFT_849119 [Suillus occidentalis]